MPTRWTDRDGWPLWRRQLFRVMQLELGRNLLNARGLWVWFLAFAPALVAAVHAVLASKHWRACSLEQDSRIFAWMFQLYFLRLACFFGCLGVFVRLFRAEIVDKTLFYSLVAPIRREILVAGKYLAGSLFSAALFALGVAVCFAALHLHHDQPLELLWSGLGAYVGITALGCFGYGSVFLALSLLFRNPVVPAVVYLGWETVSGMLPASLQWFSVTFYLKPLFPVALPIVGISGLFTVVVEPIPLWLAIGGPLLFSSVVVTLGALWFRQVELDASEP